MYHFSFTCERISDAEVLAAVDIISAKCMKRKCQECPCFDFVSGDCILHEVPDSEYWAREVRKANA